ncbi:hypothetical protein [Streptomyces microflavus]
MEVSCGVLQEDGEFGDPGVFWHLPAPVGHGAAELVDEAAARAGQPC